jgi:drug/metabolite transporter (DMT)-like permease
MTRTPRPHDNLIGAATIILTLIGWSSIPLFLKHFTTSIDAWTANGWRYAFSALLWLPVLVLGLKRKTLPAGLWKAAVWPSVFNTVAQVCFALAPYYIKPGLMTFSLRIHIVFVTIGAAIFFAAERRIIRTPWFLAGVAMVLIGSGGTVALNPEGLGRATAAGIALSIASGFLYAAYSLSVRHFMHGMNSLQAFAAISQYTALGLLGPMLIWGRKSGLIALDLAGDQMFLLLLSAVIGIGLGHTLYYVSMARLGLAVSAGVVQLQPVLVSVASFFIFGERLTVLQWVAGGVAIVGAGLILYAQQRLASRTYPGGACQSCGYDLKGLAGAPCPECGVRAAEA